MSRLRAIASRLRAQLSRGRLEAEFREELLDHFELAVDDGVRRGLTLEQARAEARRALGGLTQVAEARREGRRLPDVETVWRDIRYALRLLRARPQFAVTAILVLALGIGAVTTVFAVIDALILRPLPYPAPERLVRVEAVDPSNGTWPLPQPDVLDIQRRAGTVTLASWQSTTLAVETADGPQQVASAAVTASFFDLLGQRPSQGRAFTAEDDRPGGPRVSMVTRGFWEQRLKGDPRVLQRAIIIAGQPVTIVGVLAEPVDLLARVEVFTPLAANPEGSRSAREVEAIARLAPGTTIGTAEAELVSVMRQLGREHPTSHAGWTMRLSPLQSWIVGPQLARMAWIFFGAVVALCLLACANVGSLLLAHRGSRRQEFAMRRALGAPQARIVGQLLTESLCLAGLGALGGLLVAVVLVDMLREWASPLVPQLAGMGINATTLAFVTVVTALASVVAGLSPARQAGRAGLQPMLHTARTVSSALAGRQALVVTQVALATLLAVGATLLCASFFRLNAVDVGFDPDRALAVKLVFPESQSCSCWSAG